MPHDVRPKKKAAPRTLAVETAEVSTAGAVVREVWVHFHIFKNAGSTLDAALRRVFGPAWIELEGNDPNGAMPWDDVVAVLRTRPEIKVVSSHTLRFPAPKVPGFKFVPLFLIRHPIDRLASIYHFKRKNPATDSNEAAQVASNGTLADFLDFALMTSTTVPSAVCDAQTSWLARAGVYASVPTAADLAKAKAAVSSAAVAGIVEDLDRYLAVLEVRLSAAMPGVDLAVPDENRNAAREPSLLARLRKIRAAVPPALWKKLQQRNALDLALWRHTCRLAKQQFRAIPDAPVRLADFCRRKKFVADMPKPVESNELSWTGERLVPAAKGDFVAEHLHRYAMALEYSRGRDVLDIACGEGYGSALMARSARQVFGVDCDAATIAHATAKYATANLRFAVGRAEKLPLPAQSVDLVVSFETLEHLEDHDAMLHEIKRVLRPGGQLLISTPNRDPYRAMSGKLNPFHVRELTLTEFEQLLKNYFPHVSITHQKSFSGSLITPNDSSSVLTAEYTGSFSAVHKTKPGENSPYLLALATDSPQALLPASLFDHTQHIVAMVQALAAETAECRQAKQALDVILQERTQWARSLEAELAQSRAHFEKNQAEFDERTKWAFSLEAELQKARQDFAERTKVVAERTDWAKSLEQDLATARAHCDRLAKEHSESVAWAKSLEGSLEQTRTAFNTQSNLVEERTAWARSLETELNRLRDEFAAQSKLVAERSAWGKSLEQELDSTRRFLTDLTAEHAERTAWAKSLDIELQTTRTAHREQTLLLEELAAEKARQVSEIARVQSERDSLAGRLAEIKDASDRLAGALSTNPAKAEPAILADSLLELFSLRRQLHEKTAELRAEAALKREATLARDIAKTELARLTTALRDAQLHLDGLLRHTAHLHELVNGLGAGKAELEATVHRQGLQIDSISAALEITRAELARYEGRWLCRLGARMSPSPSPAKFPS